MASAKRCWASILSCWATWLLIAGASRPVAAGTPTPLQQYNVLYFVADDLRPEFLASYDQKVMHTPNLDALARRGLVFSHAYCSVAVCSPSRNSFMSGRRPHHTMVFDNSGTDFRANGQGRNWVTLPQHFKQHNYTTLGGGKTFHPNHPANWDQPASWSPDLPYYGFRYSNGKCPGVGEPAGGGTAECSGIDTWCRMDAADEAFYDYGLANNTIQQLRYAAALYKHGGRPFFIQSGFARPHAPWRVPARFWDLYNDTDMPLARYRDMIDGVPGVAWHKQGFYDARNGTQYVPEHDRPLPDWVQRQVRHAYYASVSWMDHQVGRVLQELDALGLADSTIVLLHGDVSDRYVSRGCPHGADTNMTPSLVRSAHTSPPAFTPSPPDCNAARLAARRAQ